MAFVHGKGSVFWYHDSGGVLRDLSAFVKGVDFGADRDLSETTTMGKDSKTYIPGLRDATISIEGFYDSTASTGPDAILWAAMTSATAKTWEYGPEGGTTGKVKYTGSSFVKSYKPGQASVDGVVPFSAEIQVTGDVTKTTYA